MKTNSSTEGDSPVAIVGIGCRFPGGIEDAASFWRFLSEERDAIAEIPRDRFDLDQYYDARPATPGRIMTRWGGFLPQIDGFDAAFFGISPREAERLDPQQRLLLETSWEALEDAGEDVAKLQGSSTGVFVGQWLSDFEARLFADARAVDFYMTTGSGRYASSGRLSYLLGLRGPSLTLDTACSSSLVATHLAVRSIRSGESELALAGGVNIILQPHISVAYSQSRMMAPDGHCKFGDASGDGYVRSEGAGIVVLKPLAAALAQGNRIYAVIRGSAVNNDGRSSGSMGTPSRVGQEELLRAAYRDARVMPGDVGYVEAHGTGTRAGDPIELGALGTVLGEGREAGRRALVGSVKTNLGHTEGAAGIAGLIKSALCLHHQAIPKSLNCKRLNPAIPWDELPVAIALQRTPWPATGAIRIAGVSAFGIAGTNAHVVMEGHVAPQDAEPAISLATAATETPKLLALSARSPEGLRAVATSYSAWLASHPDIPLAALCWNAATRRSALEHRAVLAVRTHRDAIEQLDAFAAGGSATAHGHHVGTPAPKVVWVIPGQGAQWTGMARQLCACEPVFSRALQECDAAARPHIDWESGAPSMLQQLHLQPGDAGYRLDRIDVIQPVLIALAIAYARWLESVGFRPDAVVGHSMGEVGAAYLAGVLDLGQCMRIICRRSALMRQTSGRGAMAVIELSMADVEARLAGKQSSVSVAVSNSPRSSVISGDPAAVREILSECEREGIFARLVKVDVASHSPQMEAPAAQLAAELEDLAPAAATIPIYSTVWAREAEGHELSAAYWAHNMRQPVRFSQTVTRLLGDGSTVFVELSPHPVLVQAVQQTAQTAGVEGVTTVACGRRDEPEQLNLLAVAGSLWTAGAGLVWESLLPQTAHVSLPKYPWQRERYWVRQADVRAPGSSAADTAPGLEEQQRAWLHYLRWRPSETAPRLAAATQGHWVLVSGDADWGAAVESALRGLGQQVVNATPGELAAKLESMRPIVPKGVVLLSQEGADAAFAPVATLQVCARAFGRSVDTSATEAQRPKVWLVTRGAQAVESQPRSVSIDQGAAWGAGRVLAEEHPTLWGGMIDLDPEAEIVGSAADLARELARSDGEDQIALRAGSRYVLRLSAPQESDLAPASVRWRTDGAYLITGGLGAIGLRVASAMVARGARRLILLGRSALPERTSWARVPADSPTGQRIAVVRALEMAGAHVHLLVADVGNTQQLAHALQAYQDEAWPPIVGVVHAAGILGNKLALDMDRASFDRVVHAKLAGACNLDRLLPDVEVFILFSSISALLGAPGMCNYAAANAGLDALAAARRARGVHALSIQWGSWQGIGMQSGELAERNIAELQRQGIQPFTPEEGVSVFDWLTGCTATSVTVMPVDWATFRAARAGRDRCLFNERTGGSARAGAPTHELAARLAAADSLPARKQLLESAVRETVARILRVPQHRLDSRRPLGTLGLDSLMGIELRNRLESLLGRSLSATLAWNYPTIEALVAFLSAADGVPAEVVTAPAQPVSSDVSLGDLDALSDEDIARQLRAGR